MSRLLKITDLGSGIMVQGTDNVLYPDNATLTYPYNSIVVVTDESDIATFRSASNNDVLFSGLIGKIEIGGEIVTKQNINTKFDAIANQESGGGGDVSGLFANASYDSQTKHINFYDKDNTLVAYVDATDFIKDGMVSNVEILNGNLVITFNTDAGKEPITIPLTDIFNPNNYYTKTDANALFATQTVVNQEVAARIQGDADINTTLGTKADKSDTYTKAQVDALIPVVPTNVSAFTNDAGYLTQHQSLDNYYTKTQVDTALAAKVSQTEFDTKEEVISTALNELEESKQPKLTAGANITIDANNVISSTGGTQVQSDWNQSDSTAVDYIKNKPTIPDTSDFVSVTQYNPKELAIAEALTDLNENKADKSEIPVVPDMSNYYTKTETDNTFVSQADFDVKEEVISTALNDLYMNKATKTELNAKQDTLTAGTGISIQNNVISATGGGVTQVQSDWNQSDSTAVDYIKNKPTIPTVPTNVSAFTNDAGYLTQHQSLANYYTKTESDNKYALKFTDVDDIVKVNALPANPDSRTLYLIPVQ